MSKKTGKVKIEMPVATKAINTKEREFYEHRPKHEFKAQLSKDG